MLTDPLMRTSMEWLLTCSATYLVHSSVLLVGALLVLRLGRFNSHVLAERMWKFAAVSGCLTTALQITLMDSSFGWRFDCAFPAQASAESTAADEAIRELPVVEESSATVESSENGAAVTLGSEVPGARVTDVELANMPIVDLTAGASTQISGEHPAWDVETSQEPHLGASHTPSSLEGLIGVNAAESVVTHAATRDVRSVTAIQDSAVSGPVVPFAAAVSVAVVVTLSALGILRLVLQCLRFRRQVRLFELLETGVARKCLDKLASKARLKKPILLFESGHLDEPMAFGVFNWHIVIPRGIESSFAQDELRAMLAHEMAHLVRGDGWWLWIGRALCSCLAIQPLNLLARRKWQSAGEHQCDAWAVEHLVKPLALARCLTTVAEWKLDRRSSAIGLSVAGNRSALSDRIERLTARSPKADPWRLRGRRRVQYSVAIGVLCLLAIHGPRFEFSSGFDSKLQASDAVDATRSRDRHESTRAQSGVASPARPPDIFSAAPGPATGEEDFATNVNQLASELNQLRAAAVELDRRIQILSEDSLARDLGSRLSERSSRLQERGRLVLEILSNPNPTSSKHP